MDEKGDSKKIKDMLLLNKKKFLITVRVSVIYSGSRSSNPQMIAIEVDSKTESEAIAYVNDLYPDSEIVSIQVLD